MPDRRTIHRAIRCCETALHSHQRAPTTQEKTTARNQPARIGIVEIGSWETVCFGGRVVQSERFKPRSRAEPRFLSLPANMRQLECCKEEIGGVPGIVVVCVVARGRPVEDR